MDKQEILARIDSTELKPTATEQDILQLCEDAKQYRFAAVCVHPRFVSLCARQLAGHVCSGGHGGRLSAGSEYVCLQSV